MIKAVTDQSRVAAYERRAARTCASPYDFRQSWLVQHRSWAVPEESGRALDADQAERLAAAIAGAHSAEPLVATSVELATPAAYELGATAGDLHEVKHKFGPTAYLIGPRDEEGWAVLCTAINCVIVAGPPTLIDIFAPDKGAARDAFVDFAFAIDSWEQAHYENLIRYFDPRE